MSERANERAREEEKRRGWGGGGGGGEEEEWGGGEGLDFFPNLANLRTQGHRVDIKHTVLAPVDLCMLHRCEGLAECDFERDFE